MIPHRTASYAGLSLATLSGPSIFCQIRREYMAFLVQVNDAPTLIRSRAGTSFWRLSQKSVCGVSQGLAHDEVGGVTLRAAPKCLHSKGVSRWRQVTRLTPSPCMCTPPTPLEPSGGVARQHHVTNNKPFETVSFGKGQRD